MQTAMGERLSTPTYQTVHFVSFGLNNSWICLVCVWPFLAFHLKTGLYLNKSVSKPNLISNLIKCF